MPRGRKPKRGKDGVEERLIRFGISIPAELIEEFDDARSRRSQTQNRSEAIRDLIREWLTAENWTEGKGEQTATVTLVYDGSNTELQRKLAENRRVMGSHLLAGQQVQLPNKQEVQVLVLRGPASAVRTEADSILSVKGVTLGKLVMTGAIPNAD